MCWEKEDALTCVSIFFKTNYLSDNRHDTIGVIIYNMHTKLYVLKHCVDSPTAQQTEQLKLQYVNIVWMLYYEIMFVCLVVVKVSFMGYGTLQRTYKSPLWQYKRILHREGVFNGSRV